MGHLQLNTLVMERAEINLVVSLVVRSLVVTSLVLVLDLFLVSHTLKCMMIVELDRVESSNLCLVMFNLFHFGRSSNQTLIQLLVFLWSVLVLMIMDSSIGTPGQVTLPDGSVISAGSNGEVRSEPVGTVG